MQVVPVNGKHGGQFTLLFKNKWLELVWWAGRSCHHPCRSPACSSGEGPRAASPPSPRPSGSRDPVAQPFLTAVIVSVIISAQDLTGFCDSSLKKGFLAGYCFMALKGPRQGLVLASVVLGTGDRLSNLQRVGYIWAPCWDSDICSFVKCHNTGGVSCFPLKCGLRSLQVHTRF